MLYKFAFDVNAGTVTVAQIEGVATVIRDTRNSWAIESVVLEGYEGSAELPSTHYLHAPVMTWLLQTQRADIDEAWAEYVAQQQADRMPV